jgi:hypothetical protein
VFTDFRQRQSVFTQIAGYDSVSTRVGVAFVTERCFDVLQVRSAIGRLLTDEGVHATARVAVLTDEYWRRAVVLLTGATPFSSRLVELRERSVAASPSPNGASEIDLQLRERGLRVAAELAAQVRRSL